MDIPYHLDNGEYSLDFVAPTDDRLRQYMARHQPVNPMFRVVRQDDAPDLTVVYTSSSVSQSPSSDWVSTTSNGTATIVYALLNAFIGITERSEVRFNKSFDLSRVPDAIERVRWRQTVPEVAGELFSNLVLTHALPNANHRSALSLMSMYLAVQDDNIDIGRDISMCPEVESDIDEFFAESKCLLTVRRNTTPFQILENAGVDTITRKGGERIHLTEYNLGVDDAQAHFASQHRDMCVRFVQNHLLTYYLTDIDSAEGKGKHAFTQALQRT